MDVPQCPHCEKPRKAWGKRFTKTCGSKECMKAAKAAKDKAHYEANKEQILAQKKTYSEANKEKIAASGKAWREANREEVLARQRARYEANKEKVLARQKVYRESNKEKIAAKAKAYQQTPAGKATDSRGRARRRKAKRNAQGLITPTLDAVTKRDGLQCYLCGVECMRTADSTEKRQAQLEHIIPLSGGGLHCMSNAAPACRSCNSAKQAKFEPDENIFHDLMDLLQRQTEEIMDLMEENNG